jgi:hypothetical protein
MSVTVTDPLAVFGPGTMAQVDEDPADLLSEVPPFERSAYEVQTVLEVVANELLRLEQARQAVILNFLPASADALLPMFEQLLGLPINPPGLTLAARQQLALATMRRLKGQGRGLDWEASITALFGTSWSYQEHNPATDYTNLIPNPSFEHDTVGAAPAAWAASRNFNNVGAALTCQTGAAQSGNNTMRIVSNGSLAAEGAEVLLPGTFTAGVTYTFAVYLKGNAGGERAAVILGVGGDLGTSANNVLTTAWTRYTTTWTPTANRTNVTACIQFTVTPAQTVYVDSALALLGATAPAYFSGDLNGTWTGTPGNSSSTQTNSPPANTVSIKIPQAYAGFGWPFIRDLTPAHLAITEGYSDGFFVGITNIGGTL